MKIKITISLVSALLLAGCAQLPPLNFTPQQVLRIGSRVDADLRSIAVTVAQHNEKKGEIDFNLDYSKTVPDLWKSGLEDSLNRSLAFSDGSTRKVNLRVKILQFDMPAMGASMRTNTIALYELQDRESGATIFQEEISAKVWFQLRTHLRVLFEQWNQQIALFRTTS